jgi:hypothetical protein
VVRKTGNYPFLPFLLPAEKPEEKRRNLGRAGNLLGLLSQVPKRSRT